MIVGAAVVEIHIHGSRSLKERRGVVRSISRRVRNRFNLSVSEVGGQDTWQSAVFGLSTAGTDARTVRGVLDRAVTFIEELHLAEVVHSDVEVLQLPYRETGESAWEDEDADSGETGESAWEDEDADLEE